MSVDTRMTQVKPSVAKKFVEITMDAGVVPLLKGSPGTKLY